MTKGTKAFRIIICVLLTLNILWSALWGVAFVFVMSHKVIHDNYGICVADVDVTEENREDILGDGKVSYDPTGNMLIFDNAVIEAEYNILFSRNDLRIVLIGENKFICKDSESAPAIYIAQSTLNNHLSIEGEGSLTLELQNISKEMIAIVADDLAIAADVTIITPNCTGISKAISCDSSLMLVDKATVTVQSGSGTHSMGVRVRGNMYMEEGTTLNVSIADGSVESSRALSVNGDLFVGKNAVLNVTSDDQTAALSECLSVTGFLELVSGAKVSAKSKNSPALESYGSMEINKGATVTVDTAGEGADLLCYGALVNKGGTVQGEVNALGGIHNMESN